MELALDAVLPAPEVATLPDDAALLAEVDADEDAALLLVCELAEADELSSLLEEDVLSALLEAAAEEESSTLLEDDDPSALLLAAEELLELEDASVLLEADVLPEDAPEDALELLDAAEPDAALLELPELLEELELLELSELAALSELDALPDDTELLAASPLTVTSSVLLVTV